MRSIALVLGLFAGAPMGRAQQLAIDVTNPGANPPVMASGAQTAGWSFTLSAPRAFLGLGLFDYALDGSGQPANGLASDHTIGLWRDNGTLLFAANLSAGTSVPSVTSAAGDGVWRFTSNVPFVLPAGSYRIGATYANQDPDRYYGTAGGFSTAPGIVYGTGRRTLSASLSFPTADTGSGGILGPNFLSLPALRWDSNSIIAPTPSDGSGSWNSPFVWWDGANNAAWQNGNFAIFGAGTGPAGTVTVDSGITVGGMLFEHAQSGNYVIAGPQAITLNGVVPILAQLTSAVISAPLAGAGAGIEKMGVSELTLAGPTTYTGPTSILGGTLTVDGDIFNTTSGITISPGPAGAVLRINATDEITRPITTSFASGPGNSIIVTTNPPGASGVTVASGPFILNGVTTLRASFANSARLSITGQISGSVETLTVDGGGRITWDNPANNFVGDVFIADPGTILQTNVSEAIPDNSSLTVGAGANFYFAFAPSGVETIRSLHGSGNIQVHPSVNAVHTLIVGFGNSSGDFSGNIHDGGQGNARVSLTKIGTGTQTLSGNNGYTGGTIVSAGTLEILGSLATSGIMLGDVSTGTSPVSLLIGGPALPNPITIIAASGTGTVSLGSTSSGNASFTGSITQSRDITLVGNNISDSGIRHDNPRTAFLGSILGVGNIIIDGPGLVQFRNPKNYPGSTTVNAGAILSYWNGSSVSPSSSLIVNGKVFFEGIGLGSIPSLTGDGTIEGNVEWGVSRVSIGGTGASSEFAGTVAGLIDMTKVGAGTFTLAGNNTSIGTTTISEGTLRIGNGGASGELGTGAVVNNSLLVFDRLNSLIVPNLISGTGAVTTNGAGTVTLTASNSYTGATTVQAGTLLVNGSISGSLATVKIGAVLGGSGTVGSLQIESGGTVTPGDNANPGTLNTGTFTLQSGANLALEISSLASFDRVNVTGVVSLAGNALIMLNGGLTPSLGDKFFVIVNDAGDPIGGTFSNDDAFNSITVNGVTFAVNYADSFGGGPANDVSLTVTAIPEPSTTFTLITCGSLLLGLRRRRS